MRWLSLQDVVTRCLAIYEMAAGESQDPRHLVRWLRPAQDAVLVLKNEGFNPPVQEG